MEEKPEKEPPVDLAPEEWQLWRIPDDERDVALLYEAAREFKHSPEVKARNAPWLKLSEEVKVRIVTMWRLPVLEGVSKFDLLELYEQGYPTQKERELSEFPKFRIDGFEFLIPPEPEDPENCLGSKHFGQEVFGHRFWNSEVKAFAFYINTSASEKELRDAFLEWLKANQICPPKDRRKGLRPDIVSARLRDLACRRLKKADPYQIFWKPLVNTAFWKFEEKDEPSEIRKVINLRIDKLEEWYNDLKWSDPPS